MQRLVTFAAAWLLAAAAFAQGGPAFTMLPDGTGYFRAPSARSFNTQEAPVYGGKASADDLSLRSTSHATKGKVIFGAAGTTYYDEAANAFTLATPLAIASGGTAASSASAARTSLGLAIGTNVQAYDATLSAWASFNSNGILTQTAADTFTGRTITGTANQVTVSNGNGVSGNPTLSTPQDIHTAATPQFAGLGIGAASTSGAPINIVKNYTDPGVVYISSTTGTVTLTADNSNFVASRLTDLTINQNGHNAALGLFDSRSILRVAGASGTVGLLICNYSAVAKTGAGALSSSFGYYVDAASSAGGGTFTNNYGYFCGDQTAATNNYPFYSGSTKGSGRWNFYAGGTANNYLAGSLSLGATTFDATGAGVLQIATGTAPAAGLTDAVQLYSADISAGRAAFHTKTEDGDVVKLYKVSTGWTAFANLGSDRTCDANATTVDELADILGTLIADLKSTGLIAN